MNPNVEQIRGASNNISKLILGRFTPEEINRLRAAETGTFLIRLGEMLDKIQRECDRIDEAVMSIDQDMEDAQ